MQNNDINSLAFFFLFYLQRIIEGNQRKQVTAQAINRSTLNLFNRLLGLLPVKTNQFKQVHLRNGVTFPGSGDNQSRNDCQSKRNLDSQGRAFSGKAINNYGSTNFLNIGTNHIHAHAPSGHIGHLFGSRKSGGKNKVDQFLITHSVRLFLRDNIFTKSYLFNFLRINPATIINDLNIDLSPLVESTQ